MVVRLVGGHLAGGLSPDQLRLRHGVDLDEANFALCREVNSQRGALLAVAQTARDAGVNVKRDLSGDTAGAADDLVVCVFAPGTMLEPGAAWDVLNTAAKSVLRSTFKHVRACRCDNPAHHSIGV